MSDKNKAKRWYMLVELTAELHRDLVQVAEKNERSLRKEAKRAIAAHIKREQQAWDRSQAKQ